MIDMQRTSRKKKSTRKQSKIASLMIVAAIAVVCIVTVVKVLDLKAKSRELQETEKSLQTKIEQASVEQENLIALEKYMHTPKYIEDQAKKVLGMVYPDEIVIKPLE